MSLCKCVCVCVCVCVVCVCVCVCVFIILWNRLGNTIVFMLFWLVYWLVCAVMELSRIVLSVQWAFCALKYFSSYTVINRYCFCMILICPQVRVLAGDEKYLQGVHGIYGSCSHCLPYRSVCLQLHRHTLHIVHLTVQDRPETWKMFHIIIYKFQTFSYVTIAFFFFFFYDARHPQKAQGLLQTWSPWWPPWLSHSFTALTTKAHRACALSMLSLVQDDKK